MTATRCILRPQLAPAIAILIAAGTASADVIVVDAAGGGDHLDIQPAVDAASDGDAILVKPGNYTSFTIDHKDLSVVGDGAPITVTGGITVRNTLEHHPVLLAGLDSIGVKEDQGVVFPALFLSVARGPVRVERCTLIGGDGFYCGWTCSPFDEHAGGEAVRIEIALNICFTECTIRGGHGEIWFDGGDQTRGGEGIVASGCSLSIHDSIVEGGVGGGQQWGWGLASGGDGGVALHAQDTATVNTIVHLSGSEVTGGNGGDADMCLDPGGAGGDGLSLHGSTTAGYLLDTTLAGGAPGCGTNNPPAGVPLVTGVGATADFWPGTSRLLRSRTPLREQEVVPFSFEGEPGDLVFLLESRAAGFHLLPAASGVMPLRYPARQRFRFMGSLDASGTLDLFLTMPDLPIGRESARTYTAAYFRDVSGGAWLGSPATRLVVDIAY